MEPCAQKLTAARSGERGQGVLQHIFCSCHLCHLLDLHIDGFGVLQSTTETMATYGTKVVESNSKHICVFVPYFSFLKIENAGLSY